MPFFQFVKFNLNRCLTYFYLMRLDKPIGSWLLLWPTLSALWLAQGALPARRLVIIFTLGVYVMRSAGCIINDYADRQFDIFVTRTRDRPLASRRIKEKSALFLFIILLIFAFFLVCLTNWQTILLSLAAVMLAVIYPFTKRYIWWPQIVLGLAFSWGILMAFTATLAYLPANVWWLFLANLSWILVYDTQYAMVDRADDQHLGIKSTALLFGYWDRLIIAMLQLLTLLLFIGLGLNFNLGIYYWLALIIIAILFIYQQFLLKDRQPERCFVAFLNNRWVGLALFVGIILSNWI